MVKLVFPAAGGRDETIGLSTALPLYLRLIRDIIGVPVYLYTLYIHNLAGTGAAGTRWKTKISFLCNYGVRFVLFCVQARTWIVGTLKFSWPVLIPEYIRDRNYGKECNGLYISLPWSSPHSRTHNTDQFRRITTPPPLLLLLLLMPSCSRCIIYFTATVFTTSFTRAHLNAVSL